MNSSIQAPPPSNRRLAETISKDQKAVCLRAPRWKRGLDLTVIAVAVPVIAPLVVIIAVLIKALSKGPLLFRQKRIGLGGQPFECFKFRTMRTGASTSVHEKHLAELIQSNRPMAKLDSHDPRLIPLARHLRATGLDELPQLLNVIRGEMSLVGPRPCTPLEYDAYSPAQRRRTGVLPGLTGLWQVSGKNHTTFTEMIELDLRYVRTHCLWLDLGIVLRTPVAILLQVLETVADRRRNTGAAPAPAASGGGRLPHRRVSPSSERPRHEASRS